MEIQVLSAEVAVVVVVVDELRGANEEITKC